METRPYLILPILTLILISFFYFLTLKGDVGNFTTAKEIRATFQAKDPVEFSGTPFEFSRMRAHYVLMLNIIERSSIALLPSIARVASPDIGFSEGKLYSFTQPGLAFLSAPFFVLGSLIDLGQLATFASVTLFAVTNCILLFYIAHKIFKLNEFQSSITILVYGLATSAWIYSITFMQHQALMFILLAMFVAIWKFKKEESVKNRTWLGICIWSVYGISIFFDYPNVIILSPLILYFFLVSYSGSYIDMKKGFWRGSTFALIFFALLLVYNQAIFGNPFQMANTIPNLIDAYTDLNQADLKDISEMKNNIFSILHLSDIPFGIYTELFKPQNGLLIFSPILLLGFLGIRYRSIELSLEKTILILVALTTILLYSSFGDPIGGWVFGPRYLLPVMAVLSLFVAHSFSYYKSMWYKICVFALLLYSMVNIFTGAITTMAIPPEKQTLYYGIKNLQYVFAGVSGSFVYNSYFESWMPLFIFYIIGCLVLAGFLSYLFFGNAQKNEM